MELGIVVTVLVVSAVLPIAALISEAFATGVLRLPYARRHQPNYKRIHELERDLELPTSLPPTDVEWHARLSAYVGGWHCWYCRVSNRSSATYCVMCGAHRKGWSPPTRHIGAGAAQAGIAPTGSDSLFVERRISRITIGGTPPTDARVGDLWIDTLNDTFNGSLNQLHDHCDNLLARLNALLQGD